MPVQIYFYYETYLIYYIYSIYNYILFALHNQSINYIHIFCHVSYLPRPRRGLRGIVFTLPVCVCACVCAYVRACVRACVRVWPMFWYFIFRLLEEMDLFFTKWPPAAISDDQKSLSISFLVISDQCTTFVLESFFKMAASGYFGCTKFAKIDRELPL